MTRRRRRKKTTTTKRLRRRESEKGNIPQTRSLRQFNKHFSKVCNKKTGTKETHEEKIHECTYSLNQVRERVLGAVTV